MVCVAARKGVRQDLEDRRGDVSANARPGGFGCRGYSPGWASSQGDNVIVWMPNSVDCMRVWFGINWLGATYVPINTAYKGHLLEHVLDNAGAKIMVAHASLAALLTEVDTAKIETVVIFGGDLIAIKDLRIVPSSVLDDGEDPSLPVVDVRPWDMQSIIYTSGTTGRPRA